MAGKHHSSKTKAQLSEAVKLLWQNPEYKEKAIRATLKASFVRPTAPEVELRGMLDKTFPGEWKYVGDGDFILGGKNPDFVNVNGQKAVVEVFGDYWHSERITGKSPEQEVADRVAHFARYGFKCLVVWEHEMRDLDAVAARVENLRSSTEGLTNHETHNMPARDGSCEPVLP